MERESGPNDSAIADIARKRSGEKEILNDFLKEEKMRGRREQGLTGLKNRVPKFFEFLESEGLDLFLVGVNEAMKYQGWLLACRKKDGELYSRRTVASYLVAVTAFYEFLKRNGIVLSNPFKSIRRVKPDRTLPRNLLNEKETDILLSRLARFDEAEHLKPRLRRYRIHVLAEVLYSTGLRIDEAAALKTEDVDLDRSLIHVRDGNGKGGRDRVCFLSSYARDVLSEYLSEIRPLLLMNWHEGKETLFLSGKDTLIVLVRRELSPLCGKDEIPQVRSHTFRHLLGYHLLRSGGSIRSIQSILGHVLLRNTEIYTKVDKEDLKSVLDAHHPRQWKRRAD